MLLKELLNYYFDPASPTKIEPVPYGITHHTQKVYAGEEVYIARIYNRHTKTEQQLVAEIDLLQYLQEQQFSFRVPLYLPTKNGEYYVRFADGQLGALIPFIDGLAPSLSNEEQVREYGKTVGKLMTALAGYMEKFALPELLFYRLEQVHPLTDRFAMEQFLDSPPFFIKPESVNLIRGIMQWTIVERSRLEKLPKQMIHHDLLKFNLLIDPDTNLMTGVLDFDYASYDIRVLELAICLNHLLQQEATTFESISLFLQSFANYIKLEKEEVALIPRLMLMYHVTLLAIYVGQHHGGREVSKYFEYISEQLWIRSKWLDKYEAELLKLLHETVM